MLQELHLKHIGPAPQVDLEFGDRLNIFTGDNGLGKTFLLDIVWWALTHSWANNPALPQSNIAQEPQIKYKTAQLKHPKLTHFNFANQSWGDTDKKSTSSLVLYAQVDGSFSIWDPQRLTSNGSLPSSLPASLPSSFSLPTAFQFAPTDIWHGLSNKQNKVLCNGLIEDWVRWQYQPDQSEKSPFFALKEVLKQLSHPNELIQPDIPTRVSVDDVRDIPTINLGYEIVPVTLASAGMKRILALAYLLVWSWYEHVRASELRKQEPTDHLILLIDEVESHLHPKWQRAILPAILEVAKVLNLQIKTQVLATTHSPLVLASVEPHFDIQTDRLFLFETVGKKVNLEEIPWTKYGDAVGWLTSPIFGLEQGRNSIAEIVIEAAEAFMRGDLSALPANLQTKEQIHQELLRQLPGDDPFWPRWIVETNVVPL